MSPERQIGSLALLLAGLMQSAGCGGPDPIRSGNWQGLLESTHDEYVMLELENDGHEVTGTACYLSGQHLIFAGVPVHGTKTAIDFTVPATAVQPCCANFVGVSLHAHEQSDGTLQGTLSFTPSNIRNIAFVRGGNLCENALPSP